jgi:hypothetical protein
MKILEGKLHKRKRQQAKKNTKATTLSNESNLETA